MSRDLDPTRRHLIALIAGHSSVGNEAQADAARAELRAHNLEVQIQKMVNSAPPLTDAQKSRIAVLLLASPESNGAGS
ncbi:hypothetical protein [Kitasatospora sp. MAP5-34]|uniref:hypothetical protein n=1 Tax=Kitasatospora sp. MAP5-34 TaxID=3035102 RepID=UPI002476F323|nr:hypothetical protein [Kitasatospora sp. MAP5-34]MDH6580033.1 hypothetical protein [Kitasatospora sp. MAP5-34]